MLVTNMYQVVIDTNVLVAALLSSRGASHRLLRQVGDPRWQLNLSVPLVLEYEQTLKRVCTSGTLTAIDIDDVLDFLCATASLRPIFFLWRPGLRDPNDDFILELAVESRADFLVTFNTRDFAGADQFGIRVVTPRKFLAIIGELP
jgi:putative PIN family toxin of toxin-antitoxin system